MDRVASYAISPLSSTSSQFVGAQSYGPHSGWNRLVVKNLYFNLLGWPRNFSWSCRRSGSWERARHFGQPAGARRQTMSPSLFLSSDLQSSIRRSTFHARAFPKSSALHSSRRTGLWQIAHVTDVSSSAISAILAAGITKSPVPYSATLP